MRADPPDPAPQETGAARAPEPETVPSGLAARAPEPEAVPSGLAARAPEPEAVPPGLADRAPEPGMLPPGLAGRLAAAGISDLSDPVAAWCRLRAAEGPRATGIDLYWLAARGRGLAPRELPRDERASLALAVLPGFGSIAEAGRGREPIEIAPYDPGWPERYARWRDRITVALGATALRTEHVGSTSVAGLDAKPVIDIQVSVADIGAEARYVGPLAAAGLQLRSRDSLHRFFRPFPDRPRDVHLHVCQAGGDWEREHLLFRDYLRAHPAACQRYLAGKRAAAATWRDDRFAYTEAKTGVILDILAQAGDWARDTGWALPPSS